MTVKVDPFGMPAAGVIESSCPLRVNVAGAPFTSRRGIVKPTRSRLKRDRSCVAFAVMTAVETIWFVAGVQSIVSE